MGLADVSNNYTPKENAEFGERKKLVGDAVCQVELESVTSKKTGKEWYLLKGEVINAIPDPKGREITLEAGDEITRMYDPDKDESLQELSDDLFTAGITYDKAATDAEVFSNMKAAAHEKLVYFRTWAKDKPAEKLETGKPTYWQNIKILSVSKINAENSVPQVAF